MDLEKYRKKQIIRIKYQGDVITAEPTELKRIIKDMINEFMTMYCQLKKMLLI